jgi:hypothetical protein
MFTSKYLILICIFITIQSLSFYPQLSQAAIQDNLKSIKHTDRERLVLMPIRVPEEDKNLTGAMETALVRGLQQKYDVFSGERVSQKAHEIFMKETRNASRKECDETRCLQNIAEAFQSELIAVANVTKQDGNYFLAISIQNIFDNKVVYSESLPCEKCSVVQVVDKLKILSNTTTNLQLSPEEAEAQKTAEIKNKSEQLKQEQIAFEDKLQKADATEKKRLLDAKAQDDKRLAELKAQAEVKRKAILDTNATKFLTVELALAEIKRLNEQIAFIENGYEKELSQTRKNVTDRYDNLLDEISKSQKDEFETTVEFKKRKENQRAVLISQLDAELSRLNIVEIAARETEPLRKSIRAISEQEYSIGADSIAMIIGLYDADKQQFNVSLHSKTTAFNLNIEGSIFLPPAAARTFKKQWLVGLIHPEGKLKPLGSVQNLKLISDADNTKLIYVDNEFLPENNIAQRKIERAMEKEAAWLKTIVPEMIGVNGDDSKLSFYISSTEITVSQWNAVSNTNISGCPECIVQVTTWDDVQNYISGLNKKTSGNYRLPTQEELALARKNLPSGSIIVNDWNWIEDCHFCMGHFIMNGLNNIELGKTHLQVIHDVRFHIVKAPQ